MKLTYLLVVISFCFLGNSAFALKLRLSLTDAKRFEEKFAIKEGRNFAKNLEEKLAKKPNNNSFNNIEKSVKNLGHKFVQIQIEKWTKIGKKSAKNLDSKFAKTIDKKSAKKPNNDTITKKEKPAKNGEKQIRAIMLNQEQAWNRGNLDSFMLYYWNSPKLRFVSKNKVSFGWQQVYDNYQKSYGTKGEMGKLNFDIKSIDLIGKKDALVVGSWKVENNKGIFEGHYTLWFQKMGGKWLIVLDHTS
ncbi:MAG: hypothetical protein SGJ00_11700 [bacterium]|nr:hypothetical protein [bacterium]